MRIRTLISAAGLAASSLSICVAQATGGAAPSSPYPATTQPGVQTMPGAQTAPAQNAPGTPNAPATPADGSAPAGGAPSVDASPLSSPAAPNGAVPAAVPMNSEGVPSMPPYQQQGTEPRNQVPVPRPAPQPSIAPAASTPDAPFVAMPAYGGGPYIPYGVPDEQRKKNANGSTYIPVDSWIYPEMTRLYSMGFVDTMFLGMRPWTRQSVMHMLEESSDGIVNSDNEGAQAILASVRKELDLESTDTGLEDRGLVYGTESVYTRLMGISGNTLRDSYHLGQTLVNDYGRLYQPGFNAILGASTVAEYGRFSLYVRGEYEHAPSAVGYSPTLSAGISLLDGIFYDTGNQHQATIPSGPISAKNPFRLVEASLSFHVLGHEISGGKSDAWLGPAQGGALAWSNNAEDIYSFRINRVEPLHIPFLSAVLGPLRYDFFYGSLKGHTAPNDDWTHSEMFSFRPTKNFEFGFQRTVVFGGKGHEPVTLHTFLKGFFDISDTTGAEKVSRNDPGARFSDFSASYRMPFVRKYLTFYVDSIAHDDVTPISAPRRAAFRTGLYLSQIPGMRKLDFRVEAVDTDPRVSRSTGGTFNYFEIIQRQAYTNQGFVLGDWIGREAKGGQAWLTYHLSGNEWVQLEYLNKKNDKDFILGPFDPVTVTYGSNAGTTQNQFKAQLVKRFHHDDVELNAWFQYEKWKAPIYKTGPQSNTTTAVQLTFYPGLKRRATL